MKKIICILFTAVMIFTVSVSFAEMAYNAAFSCAVPEGMTYEEKEYGTNGNQAAEMIGKYLIRISWDEGYPIRYVFEDEDSFGEEDDSAVWNEENPEENFYFLDDGLEPEEGTEIKEYIREGENTSFVCREEIWTDGNYTLSIRALAYHEGRNYEIQFFSKRYWDLEGEAV